MDGYMKKKDWIMPAALILFLLAVILIPFAAECTYAGRNESPSHILTYTTGSLTWDSDTDVDKQTGVAELSLFNSTYQNVQSENGDKVVAPGTEGKNIIRLKNDEDYSIQYVAVMYRMKEEDALPVEPVMTDDAAFTDTKNYPLPEGVTQEQVVRAVTGTVGADELQDFDITWLWQYYESDERDQTDTDLGNRAAWEIPDEVQAGLYIVVAEDSEPVDPENPDPGGPEDPDSGDYDTLDSDDTYIYPQAPRTGEAGSMVLYLLLLAVSAVLLGLLILDRRKEKQCKKS